MSLLHETHSYGIRGAAFDVYKELGSGHKEAVYERAFVIALGDRGLKVEIQKRLPVYFRGTQVGVYVPDCVVEGTIAVELKAKPVLLQSDTKQFHHYLQSTQYNLGFLINFGKAGGVEIIRWVTEKLKQSVPRHSAGRISAPFRDRNGFTLIELLISIAAFTVLLLGVVSLISNMLTTNRQQGLLLSDQDQARKVVFQIMSEFRNAAASNTGAFPLAEASAQQVTFYANVDGGVEVERVRYFLQNGELKRGIVKPTGNPLAYNFSNESVVTVQRNVANNTTPLFYYYDGSYTGVAENPLAQPVSVTAVKLMRLNLQIRKNAGVTNTNYYTVTAIGTVRNLKTNLGD